MRCSGRLRIGYQTSKLRTPAQGGGNGLRGEAGRRGLRRKRKGTDTLVKPEELPRLLLRDPRDLLDWYASEMADHGRIVLPSRPLAFALQFLHPGADGRKIVRS